jgi:hypothetical protein
VSGMRHDHAGCRHHATAALAAVTDGNVGDVQREQEPDGFRAVPLRWSGAPPATSSTRSASGGSRPPAPPSRSRRTGGAETPLTEVTIPNWSTGVTRRSGLVTGRTRPRLSARAWLSTATEPTTGPSPAPDSSATLQRAGSRRARGVRISVRRPTRRSRSTSTTSQLPAGRCES